MVYSVAMKPSTAARERGPPTPRLRIHSLDSLPHAGRGGSSQAGGRYWLVWLHRRCAVASPARRGSRPEDEKALVDAELFFALVCPMGAGGGTLQWLLQGVLEEVNYTLKPVRVIGELANVYPAREGAELPFPDLRAYYPEQEHPEQKRYEHSIEAGDTFCRLMGADALTALAIRRVVQYRSEHWTRTRRGGLPTPDKNEWPMSPLPRHAYLFRSLKRAAEVRRLEAVYGDAFFLISAYVPRELRVDRLSRKIASSNLTFTPESSRHEAEKFITTDEYEPGEGHGQDVRHAYAMADFFVDASANPANIEAQLRRFIEILLGFQFHTPTPDEQGMALANLASLRSAHLSRQVGAAITSPDGSVVAIGCNEVPKAAGGGYWPGDDDDARDFQLRKNTSLEVRDEVLREVLRSTVARLVELEAVTPEMADAFTNEPERFVDDHLKGYRALKDSRLMDIIEFDRSVHAEMMAISDAARRGVSLDGCTLYTTTFPCHNCARHIVSSGIRRTVYLHPYEKSLTRRLHGDSIGIDLSRHTGQDLVRFDPFVGISPTLYYPLFVMGKRRGEGKRAMRIVHWERKSAQSRLRGDPEVYTRNERYSVDWIHGQVAKNDLIVTNGEDDDDTGGTGSRSEEDGGGAEAAPSGLRDGAATGAVS